MIKRVVAIIPARGGSKGIPGKNLLSFCGQPLLSWSIKQALSSKYISEVYVSSDDKEILDQAKRSGANPIRRPAALATDTASSEEALVHALEIIENKLGGKIDLVVFLQATSPLRIPGDLDQAIETLLREKADSLFSAALLEDFCIWRKAASRFRSFSYDYRRRGRRQERKPLYLENGSIYVFKPEVLKKYGNRLGGRITVSIMEFWKSYEIDSREDIAICAYFMKKNILKRR
ncbi:MAG: acylneuraminate cytidylyltransferase family protein [bacterium]|nr:acylneuraminate cytidylyltransferase family protein [bacterium]